MASQVRPVPPSEEITAADAVLSEGARVTAVGRFAPAAAGGVELWVRPAWTNPALHKIAGGGVPVVLDAAPGFPAEQLLVVTGSWTGGQLTADTVEPCDLNRSQRVVPADP